MGWLWRKILCGAGGRPRPGSNFDGRTRAISLFGIGGRHAGGFVGMAPGRTPLSGASDPRKRDGTIVRIGPARPFGRECSALALFARRSEERTSELQSLMRISYAVLSLKKKHIQHQQ